MKTETVYHLDENINLIRIEVREVEIDKEQ